MKLKEVCEKTGLSRKTLRLYEEKGLIAPKKELKNGREYREYSEIDLQRLQNIALLRRAWFTMDEIFRMQQVPIGDAPAIATGKIITLLLALVSGFLGWLLHSQGGSGAPVTVLFVMFAVMAAAHIGLRMFARSIRTEKLRMWEAKKR